MKHFPSIKTVLFCGFAAMIVVLSVPTTPHVTGSHGGLNGAVPTLATVNETVDDQTSAATTQVVNNATQTDNTANQTTKDQPAQKPATPKPSAPATPKQSVPDATVPGDNSTAPPKGSTKEPLGLSGLETSRAKISKLRIHVIDGRTLKPLEGAEVVVIENEKRYKTDANGYTPWFDAPVIRNPKYRPMIAELHGQLGVIVYKNGYRDSIHLGIRMHEDVKTQTTVWMYKIGPGDRRIEPVLYQEPYHHIWLIELADKFRQKSQIGEGPERP